LALGDRVRFVFTESPSDPADVSVVWTGQYNFAVGLTRCSQYNHQLIASDVTLNLMNYDNRLYSPDMIYRVSLHEVGHLLGLMGHSQNPHDIMYPVVAMATTLSERDKTSLRKLYGAKAKITNPEGQTLSAYRKTAAFQAIQARIEALNSH
jgi:hypothetical protein